MAHLKKNTEKKRKETWEYNMRARCRFVTVSRAKIKGIDMRARGG